MRLWVSTTVARKYKTENMKKTNKKKTKTKQKKETKNKNDE